MGVNSLPKTVTRRLRGCDLNPGPSAPESSTLTTRLPSHPFLVQWPSCCLAGSVEIAECCWMAELIAAENEEDDVDFDEGKKEGRRRRGADRERTLPPLLARVNGQIEVSPALSCKISCHSYTIDL